MKTKNDKCYVGYDGYEVHLSNSLLEVFELMINNLRGERWQTCYVWYLPDPSLYGGFCSSGIPIFGPLETDGKKIGIPIWLGNDPWNKGIVQVHMEEFQKSIPNIDQKLKDRDDSIINS